MNQCAVTLSLFFPIVRPFLRLSGGWSGAVPMP